MINSIPAFSPSFFCHNAAAKHISISEASVCDEVLISDGADRKAPESYKPLWMKVSGMKNYHDLMVWTWQGSAYALAALQCGRVDAAERVLGKIAKKAVEDGTFYEVYTPGNDPRPVNKLLYHSEPDFLWSAGMFIWAAGELDKAQKNNTREYD